jgi:hypothetical protein
MQAVSYSLSGGTGWSGIDPQWLLGTPSGTTYTTGSGYQIHALVTPEPSSLLVAGLGCAGLLIRRRRRR